MAVYCRVDDLKLPAGWLPVHRDQLQAKRSVTSMGELYLVECASTRCGGVELVDWSAVERCWSHGRRGLFHRLDLWTSLETGLQHGEISQRGAPPARQQLVGQRIPGHSDTQSICVLKNTIHKKHLKNVGPIRPCEPPHAALPFTRCHRLRIDVHNNDYDDDDDNAWQRGPLWPHWMGPITLKVTIRYGCMAHCPAQHGFARH